MKFHLVNGYIKFLTHIVETNGIEHAFYSNESKNVYADYLDGKNIEYTVTEYEQPTQEILQRCEGKKFSTMQEAQAFVNTGELPLTETDILALAITELYELITGGIE